MCTHFCAACKRRGEYIFLIFFSSAHRFPNEHSAFLSFVVHRVYGRARGGNKYDHRVRKKHGFVASNSIQPHSLKIRTREFQATDLNFSFEETGFRSFDGPSY